MVLELGGMQVVYSLVCCIELGSLSAAGNNIVASFCVQGLSGHMFSFLWAMYLSWDGWATG